MKLGIISGWQDGHLKAVSEKGLSAVEFCINDKTDSAVVLAQKESIKKSSQKYGVEVGAIGRWGMLRIDENGDIIPAALQHDKNLIELAGFLGCPVYNTGCNYIEGKSYYENCLFAINYFKTLIDFAAPLGVKIAVYNCDWCNFVYNEKAWSPILGALPELGIKYDTSHAINRRSNYLREMRDWGERFYHVHIKGHLRVAGDGYDDPPAGLDQTDWRSVMCLLYIKNYDGMLSIEPHSGEWKGGKGQWGIDFTIKYISQFIMPQSYEHIEVSPYMP